MKKKQEPEIKTTLRIILHTLLIPIKIIKKLLGKKEQRILEPIHIIIHELKKTKFILTITIIILITSITAFFLKEQIIEKLVLYPKDIITISRIHTTITHGFMHANLTHLFGNLIILFLFGRVVEKQIGTKKTTITFFTALIFAAIISSIINIIQNKNVGAIGASGAIMGLVATAILLKPFKISFDLIIPLPIMILGWMMIYADITGLLNNQETNIGYAAHIAGVLSAIIIYAMLKDERKKLRTGLLVNVFSVILFLGIKIMFL